MIPEKKNHSGFFVNQGTTHFWHGNHTNTSLLKFMGRMLFLMQNKQCQSTDGKK